MTTETPAKTRVSTVPAPDASEADWKAYYRAYRSQSGKPLDTYTGDDPERKQGKTPVMGFYISGRMPRPASHAPKAKPKAKKTTVAIAASTEETFVVDYDDVATLTTKDLGELLRQANEAVSEAKEELERRSDPKASIEAELAAHRKKLEADAEAKAKAAKVALDAYTATLKERIEKRG